MKRALIWYLPQAALFALGVYFGAIANPPVSGFAMILVGVMLAAAYTGAANLVISLVAHLKRARGRNAEQGGVSRSPEQADRLLPRK